MLANNRVQIYLELENGCINCNRTVAFENFGDGGEHLLTNRHFFWKEVFCSLESKSKKQEEVAMLEKHP
jgi:hypothetical protein